MSAAGGGGGEGVTEDGIKDVGAEGFFLFFECDDALVDSSVAPTGLRTRPEFWDATATCMVPWAKFGRS